MPAPFMDQWELNGTVILLQDEGRDKANGVPVLDENAKLPLKYITPAYGENLKVSPNDPYDMNLTEWAYYLSSDGYRNPGKAWSACIDIGQVDHIAYGNSVFVNAGSYKVYTSSDGRRWNNSYTFSRIIHNLCFVNGLFLCLCTKEVRWSTNGIQWNLCSGLSSTESYYDILYANGHFVLRSTSNVYWSTDGKSWNVVSNIGQNTSIYYEGGMWFACLYDTIQALSGPPWYSTDGETWTRGSGTSIAMDTIHYSNNIWVGCASGARLCWSEDGINWTNTTTTGFTATGAPNYANGLWLIGGKETTTNQYFPYWSTDGKTWTKGTGTSNLGIVYPPVYANNIWLTSMGSSLYWSTDGKAWTLCTGSTSSMYSPAYVNGLWLAGSASGVYWSLDGKEWTKGMERLRRRYRLG